MEKSEEIIEICNIIDSMRLKSISFENHLDFDDLSEIKRTIELNINNLSLINDIIKYFSNWTDVRTDLLTEYDGQNINEIELLSWDFNFDDTSLKNIEKKLNIYIPCFYLTNILNTEEKLSAYLALDNDLLRIDFLINNEKTQLNAAESYDKWLKSDLEPTNCLRIESLKKQAKALLDPL